MVSLLGVAASGILAMTVGGHCEPFDTSGPSAPRSNLLTAVDLDTLRNIIAGFIGASITQLATRLLIHNFK